MAEQAESLFTFEKPQYAKGANGFAYVFNCYYNGIAQPSVSSEKDDIPTIDEILSTSENISFVKDLCLEFVKSCSKYFPGKKLNPDNIRSKLKHIIQTTLDPNSSENFEGIIIWQAVPLAMVVSGTEIKVHWEVTKVHMAMSLGDEEEAPKPVEEPIVQLTETAPTETRQVEVAASLPEHVAVAAGAAELIVVDDIPMAQDEVVHVMSPSTAAVTMAAKAKASKKLREARLQVQLAKFRAARAYEKYVAKYGDDLSDTDTDATTDYTSGED